MRTDAHIVNVHQLTTAAAVTDLPGEDILPYTLFRAAVRTYKCWPSLCGIMVQIDEDSSEEDGWGRDGERSESEFDENEDDVGVVEVFVTDEEVRAMMP